MGSQDQKLIYWITVSGSRPDGPDTAAHRRISDDWLKRGVDRLDEQLSLAHKLGYSRALIHNWFGTVPGEDMQLDQYWHMRQMNRDCRFDKMLSADAFVAVVRKHIAAGMEVIAYVGTLRQDPDFANIGPDHSDNVLYRLYMSLRMFLDAGCSVAFDVSHRAEPGQGPQGITYGLMHLLNGMGVRVYQEPVGYVEAWPTISTEEWFNTPVAEKRVWSSDENIICIKSSSHRDGEPYKPRTIDDQINSARTFIKNGYTPALTSNTIRVQDIRVEA